MMSLLLHQPYKDINFWGSVYCTYFAIPHLKRKNRRIVVIASVAPFLPIPRLSFYNASKAVYSMYETEGRIRIRDRNNNCYSWIDQVRNDTRKIPKPARQIGIR
uniref:Uncharacterized protein n=1 Tax=Populus trichocarpa TaxID=3694 RepID=A0A3N7HMX0_POPTR